jgi:hypothetical protein
MMQVEGRRREYRRDGVMSLRSSILVSSDRRRDQRSSKRPQVITWREDEDGDIYHGLNYLSVLAEEDEDSHDESDHSLEDSGV